MRVVWLIVVAVSVLIPIQVRSEPVTADRLSRATDDPEAYVIDGAYVRGEKRIARMRARGELPDSIPDGKCTFELAGDPSVVYYARECP